RESQQRLSLLVQQSPLAVIEWNTDFEVVAWNEAAEQIFGYTSEEAMGQHAAGLIVPEEARDIVNEVWSGLLTQTGGSRSTNDNFTKDGRTIACEWYNSPLVDADGNVLGVASLVADITERKLAEAEIEKRASELQTVAEVSTAASTILEPERLLSQVVELTKANFDLYHAHIYLIDDDGESLVLAAGAGKAGKQMLDEGWQISADSATSLVARAFRTRQGVIANDVRAAPDFLPNPLLPDTRAELAVPLIVGEQVLGVLDVQSDQVDHFTQQDVTIQTTLAGQIATAVENARLFQETRQVDRLKSEFLANMSHELRTPLNSIIGYVQLLLMDLEGEIPEDSYEDMKSVETNSQHLLNLINDVLDLARIEAGRMELHMENIDLPNLLDIVKSNNAGLFIDSPLTFSVEAEPDLPQIYADQIRITQVLNNLISNAFKFTETGGITMRAYSVDDEVRIDIEDTGIGIAEKDLDTVFERFRQVDGSFTRRAEGTGLGLSITRLLVELHGGQLSVQSKLGEGSTFTVHLPVAE
ncbi:MAG: ATP-binding protein, partial [Anaerolineae bacterium]